MPSGVTYQYIRRVVVVLYHLFLPPLHQSSNSLASASSPIPAMHCKRLPENAARSHRDSPCTPVLAKIGACPIASLEWECSHCYTHTPHSRAFAALRYLDQVVELRLRTHFGDLRKVAPQTWPDADSIFRIRPCA